MKSSRFQAKTVEPWPAESVKGLVCLPQVAAYVRCSKRHFLRMVESGAAPEPIRLGALMRWSQVVIERWVADGCPKPVALASRREAQHAP